MKSGKSHWFRYETAIIETAIVEKAQILYIGDSIGVSAAFEFSGGVDHLLAQVLHPTRSAHLEQQAFDKPAFPAPAVEYLETTSVSAGLHHRFIQ
ncbi:MAG: hypothetical protein M3Y72_09195 [Acidobacteriota bacterium]|nr:hypothetical protein [Acidobacteriota bacterium]